jgi:hypothetical protein
VLGAERTLIIEGTTADFDPLRKSPPINFGMFQHLVVNEANPAVDQSAIAFVILESRDTQ